MLRTGIYRQKQLKQSSLKDIFGKEKNISIYLYQQLNQGETAEEKNGSAELILNRFNSDRNVVKRTYKNRFDNFDGISINIIAEQKYESNSVLDIAISDGRASCYFLEHSINQLQNLYYTGSDLQVRYYLNKKTEKDKAYIITDESKKIVEITDPPFVWNLARQEGKFYFMNNLLKSLSLKIAQNALSDNKYKYQEKIELIHPDFKSLQSKSTHIEIRNYSIFDTVPGSHYVIRAMNILHFGYFTKDQLLNILTNIYNGLVINGLLIEGSNENAGTPVDGAIYKKTENGFVLLKEPEKPSRIKELVLSFHPVI